MQRAISLMMERAAAEQVQLSKALKSVSTCTDKTSCDLDELIRSIKRTTLQIEQQHSMPKKLRRVKHPA